MRGFVISVVMIAALSAGEARAASDAGADRGGAAFATPAVSATLSATEVELGRPFHLVIHAVHDASVRVSVPAGVELGPAVEELRRSVSSTVGEDGKVTEVFDLELMAFEVGEIAIPPIRVVYDRRGASGEIATEPMRLAVTGVLGDGEATLRDIASPVAVTAPNWLLVYAAGGLAALLLAAALVLAVRRRRRRRTIVVARTRAPAPRPAHEEALARLDQLEASGLVDADDRKPAYHELSEILRAYLGRRYGFPALDLTTREIRAHFAGMAGGEELDELVGEWLERCDLVKFAGSDASADEARQALYDARRFVDQTTAVVALDRAEEQRA